ncbi:MAG: TonB-dependent receptor plug domain-containing protein [Pseudohongiellaceae bacterium]
MGPRSLTRKTTLRNSILAALALTGASLVSAQTSTGDSSTVVYPASYFAQYEPFSVSDMLNRIPGITVALQGSGGQGGPGSSGGSNRRGLGAGGDQVLINGRRTAGKENEGNSQLSRISASQVDYIEIIRGTSGDLDVRGGGQVINIVLLESESRSSVAYELNTDHYHDGTYQPGGKVALSGQRGVFDYLLSAEIEPRWEYRDGDEVSVNADGSLNDTVTRIDVRDSQPITVSANLGYEVTPNDLVHFNMQYADSDAPSKTDRVITDYNVSPQTVVHERDDVPSTNDSWEVGGDYEHLFANGSRFKTLFIVNESEDDSTRETFILENAGETKDLYLANFARNRERIVRSSYTFGLAGNQSLEAGVERAQTILDSSLQLGLLTTGGTPSAAFGGLTPVTNSNATVEEIRYETFLVHNWQLNPRMSLESTLLYETSEISQSGDVSQSRDFSFVRPKLDYRFDITPSVQFRASVEKDVAQLSFNDFTANISGGDDDQDAVAGNPDLRQEQSWRYETTLEYRLPGDAGVLSTNLFYHDLEDVIDRVDVSTPTALLSANGNIGDGERYGINIDASLRLGFIDFPNILVTSRLQLEDSKVTDPFLGIERRLRQQGRGSYRIGYRHDLPSMALNYGFNFSHGFTGERFAYDIDKIEEYEQGDNLTVFVEKIGWGGLTYRFETMNTLEGERCRVRSRYTGGTIATGVLNEIEDSCSNTGIKIALKVRGTF